MDSSTAPILKNSTMVTVLDRKFVMMMASRNRTAMIPNCGRSPMTGCRTLPSHTLIPVDSADSGTAKQDTVPAKSRGGHGTCFIAAGTFRTALPLERIRARNTIPRIAGITTPMLFM